jgi:hypothetical protein
MLLLLVCEMMMGASLLVTICGWSAVESWADVVMSDCCNVMGARLEWEGI